MIFGFILATSLLVNVTPADDAETRIAVYGDVRQGQVPHSRIADTILRTAPDAVFVTGDLVQRNEDQHWAAFEAATRDLRAQVPYFPAIGNHDVEGILNESAFDEYFANGRFYEVRIDELALVVIDTSQSVSAGSIQGHWIARRYELARQQGLWMAAAFHHPVVSSGPHGPTPQLVRDLQPVFERYGVHVVFQGHDHMYERAVVNGVTYIVTGGGGAPLYTPPNEHMSLPTISRASVHHWVEARVQSESMSLTAIDIDGNTIDSVVLSRDDRGVPPVPADPTWWFPLLVALGTACLAGVITFWIR